MTSGGGFRHLTAWAQSKKSTGQPGTASWSLGSLWLFYCPCLKKCWEWTQKASFPGVWIEMSVMGMDELPSNRFTFPLRNFLLLSIRWQSIFYFCFLSYPSRQEPSFVTSVVWALAMGDVWQAVLTDTMYHACITFRVYVCKAPHCRRYRKIFLVATFPLMLGKSNCSPYVE